jgi:DNA-binding beta-propeller fold protein YncE
MRLRVCMLLALLLAAGCGRAPNEQPASAGPAAIWGSVGTGPGQFLKPRAIASAGGQLFVVDMSGRIQRFDLDGRWQTEWKLEETSHGFPSALTIAPDGRLVVADTHNHRVLFCNANGAVLGVLGKEGGGPGELTYATDAKFDRAGNLYVSDHGREDRILKFDASGRFVTSWGRSGDKPGEFRRVQALAVDDEGCVYAADAANHRVQKFSPEGAFLASWGAPGHGPGELLYPYALAMTPGSILAVCEYGNNRIQLFDSNGHSVGMLGGPGRAPGELASPRGIAYVPGRGLYVADVDNHRVQLFALPGAPAASARR